jgi:hypothetical protein
MFPRSSRSAKCNGTPGPASVTPNGACSAGSLSDARRKFVQVVHAPRLETGVPGNQRAHAVEPARDVDHGRTGLPAAVADDVHSARNASANTIVGAAFACVSWMLSTRYPISPASAPRATSSNRTMWYWANSSSAMRTWRQAPTSSTSGAFVRPPSRKDDLDAGALGARGRHQDVELERVAGGQALRSFRDRDARLEQAHAGTSRSERQHLTTRFARGSVLRGQK